MAKIAYIVQDDGTKNFSSLLNRVDDIVVVVNRNYPLYEEELKKKHVSRIIRKLSHFNVAQDYLVLVGDPVNIGIAMFIILKKGGGNFLRWDRQSKLYQIVKLEEKDL